MEQIFQLAILKTVGLGDSGTFYSGNKSFFNLIMGSVLLHHFNIKLITCWVMSVLKVIGLSKILLAQLVVMTIIDSLDNVIKLWLDLNKLLMVGNHSLVKKLNAFMLF